MKTFWRLFALAPICVSLSACADAQWLTSFLRSDPPMQAAHRQDDPAPRRIPAAFVQAVPAATAPAIAPITREKITLQPKKMAVEAPKQRVITANDAALQEPSADGYINAIQVYQYAKGELYRLYTAPQEVSDIALQPGENLTAISAGDTTRWVVGDTTSGAGPTKQVHILAKPFAAGQKTNLVITTDRRSYHLELESTKDVFMAAVSWSYPQDDIVKADLAAAPPSPKTDGLTQVDKLHFDYAISGDDVAWKPLRAFDDGTHVYIQFPSGLTKGDAPPLFVSGPGGNQDLVNYRVRGTYYIVDQLFSQAELRFGQDHQKVVKIKRNAPLQALNLPRSLTHE